MKLFSELTGKEQALEAWRWLCVPLVAVLTVVALGMASRLMMPPVYAQPPGTPPMQLSEFHQYVLPRIFGILMAAFVVAGAKTAPRFRLATAVALAAGWIAYAMMNFVLIHLGRGAPHYLNFTLAIAATAGAAGYIFYSERKGRSQ
jgi:hypothetical protein